MATVKVTVTLEEGQVEAIRRLVAQRNADSVSGFVKHAVGVSLADVTDWSPAGTPRSHLTRSSSQDQ